MRSHEMKERHVRTYETSRLLEGLPIASCAIVQRRYNTLPGICYMLYVTHYTLHITHYILHYTLLISIPALYLFFCWNEEDLN